MNLMMLVEIAVILGVVLLALPAACRGDIVLKRWTIPLFIVMGLLSFPLGVVSMSYLEIQPRFGEWRLSPDITNTWAKIAWLQGFLGAASIWAMIRLGGIRIDPARNAGRWVKAIILLLLFCGLADSGLFMLLSRVDMDHRIVARSVSPDGRTEGLVAKKTFIDIAFKLIAQKNSILPVCARDVAVVCPFSMPTNKDIVDKWQLTWSHDSNLAVFYIGAQAMLIYDFQKQKQIEPNEHKRGVNEEAYFIELNNMAEKEFAARGGKAVIADTNGGK